MRPEPLIAVGAAAVFLTGGGVAAYRETRPEPIKQPVLSYEQTDEQFKVVLRNPNKTWGFRNQRVLILLRGSDGNILTEYGPDYAKRPPIPPLEHRPPIDCCLIEEFPPGGEVVFTLWPVVRLEPPYARVEVKGLDVRPHPYGRQPRWERWDD